MSCTELGFDPDYGIRLSKSDDLQILLEFPEGYDLAGYDGSFAIKGALDDVPAELTVGTTATGNGSVMVFSENTVLLTLKEADNKTLPDNAADAGAPWVGWFEWTVTDPYGLKSRLYQLPLIAERGADE